MSSVSTEITITSLYDLMLGDTVRRIHIPDAVVDESVMFLTLPRNLIDVLGLSVQFKKWSENVCDPVRVRINGREAVGDPIEALEGTPVRVGICILAMMDLVIDRQACKLIGNPAHGGEQILQV